MKKKIQQLSNNNNKKSKLKEYVSNSSWNFHELSDRKIGVITKWIKDAKWSVKTRANFDRSIDQLRHVSKMNWSKPNPASKIGDETYVIRFKDVTSMKLRLYGHFFEPHKTFVLTTTGYEKDNVYYPENYEIVAQSHRTICDKDFRNTTIPFEETCAICIVEKDDIDRSQRLQQISSTFNYRETSKMER